ncbi:hypothetical protein BME75_26395 [Klebsiella pneumoniae]|nr:hypothetical protein BME21_26140 [Klebsiella pneumoniae]OVY05580.1 hypothetical protein BME75_26395 [Klebsiella pneumoniae]OVY06787.1 hypothetical protein BME72_26450 [Klebsiella pneumoniae]
MSGFATTDLSVKFCDACQGGGAYGKTAVVRPCLSSCCLSYAVMCALRPLAAAERQERSD